MFVTLIVVGVVGLAVMALPALGRFAPAGPAAHALHATHALRLARAPAGTLLGATKFLLSPRALFSVIALYGALGNALVRAGHLTAAFAGVLAVLPALAIERFLVAPLWALMFRYQAAPSSPLYELILCDAKAVTPFKNGRGVVAVERDGRLVQFVARLPESQAKLSIRVGDVLRVDEVDGKRECLLVSLPAGQETKAARAPNE